MHHYGNFDDIMNKVNNRTGYASMDAPCVERTLRTAMAAKDVTLEKQNNKGNAITHVQSHPIKS